MSIFSTFPIGTPYCCIQSFLICTHFTLIPTCVYFTIGFVPTIFRQWFSSQFILSHCFCFCLTINFQSDYLLYAGKVTVSTFITEEISCSSLSSLFLHTPHTHHVSLFNLTINFSSFQYFNAHFLTKIVERKKWVKNE